NQVAVPEFAFSNALMSARYQNHLRRRLLTPEMINEWNLDKSMAFYKDRFADASDFTFVLVGSFDAATMRPLVEKHLGSLPSIHRKESWKDVGVRPPADVVVKKVEKGVESKSLPAIAFSGPFVSDQQVNDEKEALLREYETNSKLNKFLLAQISARYENGEDPAGVWRLSEYYQKINKAMIQEAAKTYLNTNRYVEVMLFPEKK